jgi:SAM-dependent methyltransferase
MPRLCHNKSTTTRRGQRPGRATRACDRNGAPAKCGPRSRYRARSFLVQSGFAKEHNVKEAASPSSPAPARHLGAYEKTLLTRQFGHPAGPLGWLVSHLMALEHGKLYRAAVDLLDVQPDDRVLEIGFGPGSSIRRLAERATRGFVAGVELSALMVRQPARRNRKAIKAGRVELRHASVSDLPHADRRFTKVCAINCFQDWPDQPNDLREVYRVTADGGLLLLWLPMKRPDERKITPGFTDDAVTEIGEMLEDAGFHDVRTHVPALARPMTCVLANR